MRQTDSTQRRVDSTTRGALARGGKDLEVLVTSQMTVKSRFVDDGSHARQRYVSMARRRRTKERHGASVGVRKAEEDPDEGRLTGAVGSEVAEGATSRHEELNAIDRYVVAEALGQSVCFDCPLSVR